MNSKLNKILLAAFSIIACIECDNELQAANSQAIESYQGEREVLLRTCQEIRSYYANQFSGQGMGQGNRMKNFLYTYLKSSGRCF